MATLEKVLEVYHRRGWYPLSVRHLPEHIRMAIRHAGFRPMLKACQMNSQKLVLMQRSVPLTYCEGLVESDTISGYYFEHAWIMDINGFHHDITLNPMPKIISYSEYSIDDIRRNIRNTEAFSFIDHAYLGMQQFAVYNGIDMSLSRVDMEREVMRKQKELQEEFARLNGGVE